MQYIPLCHLGPFSTLFISLLLICNNLDPLWHGLDYTCYTHKHLHTTITYRLGLCQPCKLSLAQEFFCLCHHGFSLQPEPIGVNGKSFLNFSGLCIWFLKNRLFKTLHGIHIFSSLDMLAFTAFPPVDMWLGAMPLFTSPRDLAYGL